MCDYAIHFRTLATDSGWNSTALYDVFLKGLSDQIQDLLVPLDLPSSLDSIITLAIRTDKRLQERRRDCNQASSSIDRRRPHAASSPATWQCLPHLLPPASGQKTSSEKEEPMQLGQAKLSTEEHRRHLQEGRCFYCGQQGHLLAICPAKAQAHQ